MKVYFACSIRGGRDEADSYRELAMHIKSEATLLTEIFADGKLTSMGMDKDNSEIWKTDMDWVQEADIIVAEVTTPSLGVGYEIAKAEEWNKPVLALYRNQEGKRLSAMIDGSPKTKVIYYDNIEMAKKEISEFLRG